MFPKNHPIILIFALSYFKLNHDKEEKITDVRIVLTQVIE